MSLYYILILVLVLMLLSCLKLTEIRTPKQNRYLVLHFSNIEFTQNTKDITVFFF